MKFLLFEIYQSLDLAYWQHKIYLKPAKYYSDKFYYKNITIKKYLKYNDRNPNFINDDKNSLSKINKNLKKLKNPLNPKRKHFTEILNGANY